MAKQSLLVPTGLYNVGYSEYGNFIIFPTKDKASIWNNLLSQSNTNLVLNFDDKKDKRRRDTKIEHSCDFTMASFAQENYPQCDFTFNQEKFSSTVFKVLLQNRQFPSSKINFSDDNTFTFNGLFDKIYISNSGFRNCVFNGYDKNQSENAVSRTTYLSVYDSLIKNLKISNQETITTENISASHLNSLTFDNCRNVHLSLNNINSHNLQTINCKTVNEVQLNFGDYRFNSLKINKERYSSYSPASNFINEYDSFVKETFNPSCEFIFDPKTKIYSYDYLPENKSEQYGSCRWSAAEIFPEQANNKEIKVKLIDLLLNCYKMKKAAFDKEQNELLAALIEKQKAPISKQSKEREI